METREVIEGPRPCRACELGATLDLMNLVFCADEPRMGTIYPGLVREANLDIMRIIKVNKRVVAHSAFHLFEYQTPLGQLKLAHVGQVACHPDFRRRGFGEAVVENCMEGIREYGCHIGVLGTGIPDWYRRFGWERAGSGYSFNCDRATVQVLPSLEAGYDVAEGMWDEPGEMVELYHQHGIGALRTAEDFAETMTRPDLTAYTASRDGKLAAYIILETNGSVDEHAGDAHVAAGLIKSVALMLDDPARSTSSHERPVSFSIMCPPLHGGLKRLLLDLGVTYSFGHAGMIWIPDYRFLLDQLGLSGISVDDKGERVRLGRGGQSVELAPRQVVKLIFGPERVSDFASDVLPVPFCRWPLDCM